MKKLLRSALLPLLLCQAAAAFGAESPLPRGNLSLQGFSGVLNTPDARVSAEGWLDAAYTNQKESQWRKKVPFQDNYLVSVGFFDFLEVGGRFTEARNAGRDLSANLKLSSGALTRNYPLIPVLAVGVQDLGGGAAMLKSRYLVVSEELGPLRVSAGYGLGPDRMKGGFAGGALKLWDWFELLGEYDTRETNLGARVLLPQFWKIPVRLSATAKTSLDYRPGNFDVAVGFSVPLDFRVRAARPAAAEPGDGEAAAAPRGDAPLSAAHPPEGVLPGATQAQAGPAPEPGEGESPEVLRGRLVQDGMLNVGVGGRGRTLVVEYENSVFNHNELDALGLVAGRACRAAGSSWETLELLVKRRNLTLLRLRAPVKELRRFLAGDTGSAPEGLRIDVPPAGEGAPGELANRSWLNTQLVIAPGLTTFIGTEYAPFDYLLSAKPELTTQLWTGALLHARWDIPLAWSDNLDDGKPYRSSRASARLERLMLFQAIEPLPALTVSVGGGMVVHDRYGTLNEVRWSPGEGRHRLRLLQGWTREDGTGRNSRFILGSYRYFWAPLDLTVEGTAGRFWSEDEGGALELKRFWRDTAVSLYYKDTKGTDQKRWRAVGLQLSFPLTPRRDMRPVAKLQVRGSDEWSYAQETTLKNNNVNSTRGSLNYLAPYPLAIIPQPAPSLDRSLYNRDRLSPAYLRQHLDRLREAWLGYGAPET